MFTTMSLSDGQPESTVQDIEDMVRSYVEKVKRSFSIFVLIYPHSSLVEC
jgi:hypothetical protein